MLRLMSDDIIITNDMLDLIVEYYMATYETLTFRRPFGEGAEDSIIITVKMNQFGRCRIGSEVFSSLMSTRHVKNSFILVKFMTDDRNDDCFLGQIQVYPNEQMPNYVWII